MTERRPSGNQATLFDGWTREVEDICERIRVNSVNLSEYHRRRFYYYKSYGKYFRIPVIVLASINATASVGLTQLDVPPKVVSGITCLLGMIIGTIGAVEMYLNIQQSMELELKQSKEFYTLAIDLYKTLKLAPPERGENGLSYMNKKYSIYVKLRESSSLHRRKMRHDVMAKVPVEEPDSSIEEELHEKAAQIYDSFPRMDSLLFTHKEDV